MRRSRLLPAAALVLLATLLAYANHFRNGFHFDDSHTVQNNLFIRDLRNVPRYFADGTTFSAHPWNQTYRPLVSTTLAIDYRLGGGLDPFFFHLSTFLLFLAQGALMFLLFRGVYAQAAPGEDPDGVALFAVGWYLLHPANAETINYVIARGDSLSTLFVVLTVVLYAAPRTRRLQLHLLAAALGVLAKPVAAVFPLLLLGYELLAGSAGDPGDGRAGEPGLPWRRALRATAPAFTWAALLLLFVHAMSPKTWFPGGASRLGYVLVQPLVLAHYVGSFFLPLGLSADTDWQALSSIADPRFLAGAAFCVLLAAVGVLAARRPRWRPVALGVLWFFVANLPTSVVFPLAEVTNDHRMFFPFVGLAMAVSWSVALAVRGLGERWRSPRVGRLAAAAAVALLAAYAVGTHRRNEVWRTEESLWRDATEKSPGNGRAWMNFGLALMGRGDHAGAEAAYRKALALAPDYQYLHVNLAILQAATGRPAEAERHFMRAIELGSSNPEPIVYYARFLAQQGRRGVAIPLLREAIRLSPAHLDARRQLLALFRQGQDPGPIEEIARELDAIAPGDPVAQEAQAALASRRRELEEARTAAGRTSTPEALLELSLRAHRAGDYAGSIAAAERALLIRPGYAAAYNNICAAHNAREEWEQAVAACERAAALDPGSELARNNLAWAKRGGSRGR